MRGFGTLSEEGNITKLRYAAGTDIAKESYIQIGSRFATINWNEMPSQDICLIARIGGVDERAVLDLAGKFCYISRTFARRTGQMKSRYDPRFEAEIRLMCEEKGTVKGKATFQVLKDSDPKFGFGKEPIILGRDLIDNINFNVEGFKKVYSDILVQKQCSNLKQYSIVLLKSQPSKSQQLEFYGPFSRSSSHHLADEGYTEIMTSDRGIIQAFALFESRLEIRKGADLTWFSENCELIKLYYEHFNNKDLTDKLCVYWTSENACPEDIKRYVISDQIRKVLFQRKVSTHRVVGKFLLL